MIIGKLYRLEDEPNATYRLIKMVESLGVFNICDKDGKEILEQFPTGLKPATVVFCLRINELKEVNEGLIYPMDYEEWLKQPSTREKLEIIRQDLSNYMNGEQLELF